MPVVRRRRVMTESEIRELEKATQCRVPTSYGNVLLDYPARLTELAVQMGDHEPEELFSTKKSLLDANVNDREYMQTIFPSDFLVIGQSGCGDYYAIDTTKSEAPVFIGGPHEGEYPEDGQGGPKAIATSIESHVDRLISDLSEVPTFEKPRSFRENLDLYLGTLMVPVMLVYLIGAFLVLLPLTLFHIVWRAIRRA